MAGGEVVRWNPDIKNREADKPMYMSKNGRYVHYNDWKKEREMVNALKAELTRMYLAIEGVVDVDINLGGTTMVFSLDTGTGDVP